MNHQYEPSTPQNIDILSNIALHNLLHDTCRSQLGLMYGKMGLVIFYFYYARYIGNSKYENLAALLFKELCEEISLEIPLDFGYGLCGIGFGVELLKMEGFIFNDSDEILCDVDRRLNKYDISKITDVSLEHGLAGIVIYVRSRMESKRIKGKNSMPFDTNYINSIVRACEKIGIQYDSSNYELHKIWLHIVNEYFNKFSKEEWQRGINLMLQTQNIDRSDLYLPRNKVKQEEMVSSKKCILIFSEECKGSSYGVGTFLDILVKCFRPSEWNIYVITLFSNNQQIVINRKESATYIDCPNMNSMGLSTNNTSRQKYITRILFSLCSYINMEQQIYCHFNYFTHIELARLIKNYFSAKIYLTVHYTSWSMTLLGDRQKIEEILQSRVSGYEKNIKDRFLLEQEFMLKYCDKVIAISRHSYIMLQTLYKLPAEKTTCIPHGFCDDYQKRNKREKNILRKKYGFRKEDKIIMYAGRLDEIKGITRLVSAFGEIVKREPNAKLVISGTGSFQRCMELSYPHWNKIIYTGFLSKKHLYELYAIVDVGIVPSVYEEFGYVAGEMMLNELPIIVSETSGLKEIVKHRKYGDFFNYGENGNVNDLIDKVILALNKKKNQNVNGRKRILQEFSFEKFSSEILRVYN